MAQWVRSGININFIGHYKKFAMGSLVAVLATFVVMTVNYFVRGSALNYGTDFKGGSQAEIEFARTVSTSDVRSALEKNGFQDAEVVELKDEKRASVFLLRLTEVSGFEVADQQKAKTALEQKFGKQFVKFSYENGSDKLYLRFAKDFTEEPPAIEALFREKGVSFQQIQRFGRAEDRNFEVTLGGLSAQLRKVFEDTLGKGVVKDIPQVESVGARMGEQLRNDGIKSIIYSLLLMLVYIAFRFDFRYAPGGIVALAHDVIVTTGIFAVFWIEFSLPVVAALLTIAGYSINDTIVIFDRIRENVTRLRDRKFALVVNTSLNETLSRTILTSLTVLFTCVSVLVFGTGALKTFALALVFGIFAGTYSTLFIATPMTIYLNDRLTTKKAAS